MLRLCGADLRLVPAVPYANPMNYVRYSEQLWRTRWRRRSRTARSGPTSSTISPTAAPITRPPARRSGSDTEGKVDAFVASVGTGGTLAGVAMALKERNPSVKICLADPMGSAIYSYYAHGELKAEGNSITEGIGQGRITKNLEGAPLDGWFQVTDEEMLPVLFDLVLEEGLILGGSTGINILGAIKAAQGTGPRPHHRHHPRRLRHALSVEAVQSRLPARAQACPCRTGSTGREGAADALRPSGSAGLDRWLAAHLDDPEGRDRRRLVQAAGRHADRAGGLRARGTFPARCSSISTRSPTTPIRCRTCCRAPRNSRAASALGLGDGQNIVVYDGAGTGSAPRVWWMLRVFGHGDVAVLDGGLPKWLAEGRPVTAPCRVRPSAASPRASRPRAACATKAQLVANLTSTARASGRRARRRALRRHRARAAARPARGPHPGQPSTCLGSELTDPKTAHRAAGRGARGAAQRARASTPEQPVVASCGSGVSACVVAFATPSRRLAGGRGL